VLGSRRGRGWLATLAPCGRERRHPRAGHPRLQPYEQQAFTVERPRSVPSATGDAGSTACWAGIHGAIALELRLLTRPDGACRGLSSLPGAG